MRQGYERDGAAFFYVGLKGDFIIEVKRELILP